MKKIGSFMSRNFPTMEKRVFPSSIPLGISSKKPMKRTVIHKKKNKKHNTKDLIFNKVVSYLISDSYMYNPLVSPQSSFDFTPPKQIFTSPGIQEDVALPIKENNKKLIEKVVDFLVTDCYLYSPLITNEHVCSKSHAANTSSGHFSTLGGSESTKSQGSQMQQKDTVQEGGDLSRQLRARPVGKKTVAYRGTVKHMVP